MNQRDILQFIFPYGTISYVSDRDDFEINGLTADTLPQNCEILMSAVCIHSPEWHWYLVTQNNTLLLLRICVASSDSDYARYATGKIKKFSVKSRLYYLTLAEMIQSFDRQAYTGA